MLKKKLLIGALALAFVLVVGVSTADAYSTLKLGSSGPDVVTLQTKLAISADGKFGPMTKAAVMAFQSANGLVADGVVGTKTWAALMGTTTLPAGCQAGWVVNPVTGASCTAPTLPAGCQAGWVVNPMTGASCTGTPTTNGPLAGGAGTLAYSATSTGVEDTLKEGEEDVKVLAFKAEAEDSDIKVTNIKLSLQNDGYNAGDGSSEKLTNYVDEVSVWMGSTKVATVDASDFSRDSGSPDVFTKTLALNDAIVRDGVKATFYVTVSAVSSIDSEDMDDASWIVDVLTVRYQDATGVIMSDDLTEDYDTTFGFEDISTDDGMSIKSSSANPVATVLQVDDNADSDEFLVGAFKLDADDNSSDVTVTEMAVVLHVDDSDDTANSDDAEDIISEVVVKIDGTSYTAELDKENITNGNGTADYLVTIDEGDLVVDAGDQVEVKVYVTFNEQDGYYGTGTTVYASVAGTSIDAEGTDAEIDVSGTFTGKTHTLSVNAPVFSLVSKSFALYQSIDGVATDEEDIFLAKFIFNVTAGDEDVYLSKGMEGFDEASYDTAADEVQYTKTNGGDVDSMTLDADDESIDDGLTSSYLVTSGSTEKFTLSFYVRGNNDSCKIVVDSFAYGDADDTATQYEYNSAVSSGLTSFATNSTYLAK